MKTERRKTGDIGEAIAGNFLANKGFSIIAKNYWKPFGEIDLVCSKSGVIHFIEVKSVSCEIPDQNTVWEGDVSRVTAGWNPGERINPHKLRRLQRAISAYLGEFGITGEWQIDAALVYMDPARKRAKVEFFENVH